MVVRIVLLALVPLFLASSSSLAKKLEPNLVAAASGFGVDLDAPSSSLGHAQRGGGADTVSYGDIGPDGFSIFGDVWDWDDPDQPGDPLMGWYATDTSVAPGVFGRRVDASIWDGHDNTVDAPILTGSGSLWIGAFEDEADGLCYVAGLGYGTSWCQLVLSPVVTLDSSADIDLSFRYFNETELNFDYTRVLLRTIPDGDEIVLGPTDGFTGPIGLASDSPLHPPVGQTFHTGIPTSALNGATQFQLVFQMTSDGGWDDEDGDYDTDFGPFGLDDVVMSGGASLAADFELDEDGWTFEACPGVGTYFGVGNLASYQIAEVCGCGLSGNLAEFHDDTLEHPSGQRVEARSNMTDVLDMGSRLAGNPGQLEIFADWDQYSVMPRVNGVFYRPGWDYYPFECAVTGAIGWSGRVGLSSFFYNPGPDCSLLRNIATSSGIPPSCERIKFIFELYASCDRFGIPESECTNQTNFTPIIDNVRVRGTKVPVAPIVVFTPSPTGTRYQDGFAQTFALDPNGIGNADINYNAAGFPGNDPPYIMGDSLCVRGPVSTLSTMWEARLWFKVRREGPGTKRARYLDWKSDVTAIHGNPDPTTGFAYAWMDSFETASGVPAKNQFVSYCREDNWYPGESGEFSDGNEIIRDGVLVAGTAIDYFVTSNYIATPNENFYLPDTTGGFFFEFEILPSWRLDAGHLKFPCLLYVDTNSGAEPYVESALGALGLDHDRFDYNDATSSWKVPMNRGSSPSNNGVSLPQLAAYRTILVNTGGQADAMWREDDNLFREWLTNIINPCRRALIMNGDNLASTLADRSATFLNQYLGATLVADAYHDGAGGDDQNYCVRLEAPVSGGESYGTVNSHEPGGYQYDAWGNWCPQQFRFDVLGTIQDGVGNRAYLSLDGPETEYAQVTREDIDRLSILDGTSWHHLSERDPADECAPDSAHIVTAIYNEIAAALEWAWGGPGNIPTGCDQDFFNDCTSGAEDPPIVDAGVTRLYQNVPNPFNPRTLLRFTLAQSGPVRVTIFDVNGRKVRSLVDGSLAAGLHEVVWDGLDDAGHPGESGVYWSQLEAGSYRTNKKMIALR